MSATTSALPLPIATDSASTARQSNIGRTNGSNANGNPLSPNASGRPIRPGPSPLAPSYMMAAAASGASPMSLGMSFGMSYNGGNFGKSWKQSYAGGGGMGAFARGAAGAAFGSYAKDGMGSFTMGGLECVTLHTAGDSVMLTLLAIAPTTFSSIAPARLPPTRSPVSTAPTARRKASPCPCQPARGDATTPTSSATV